MSECVCDYDYDYQADINCTTVHRARKQFKCYECHHAILPGDKYERNASLYEGRWNIARTCPRCLAAREYITAHAPCFCWLHGSMLDDARETVNQYGHVSAGFYIGAMKRILRAERQA